MTGRVERRKCHSGRAADKKGVRVVVCGVWCVPHGSTTPELIWGAEQRVLREPKRLVLIGFIKVSYIFFLLAPPSQLLVSHDELSKALRLF